MEMQAVEKLIEYRVVETKSKTVGAYAATLFFAGQRFHAQMCIPKDAGVDCQAQVRRCLEGMVLVGLAQWMDGSMEGDSDMLESGHLAEGETSKPLARPKNSERVSRRLESEPISAPLPQSEPLRRQHEKGA